MKELLILSLTTALISCGGSDEGRYDVMHTDQDNNAQVGCGTETPVSTPAIVVEVMDKATGAFIACDAVLTVQEDSFQEVGGIYEGVGEECYSLGSGLNRPGVYNVTVELDGYQTWYEYNVEVTQGDCSINTVTLQAYLEQ